MTGNNPKLDLVNAGMHIKFGQLYQFVLKILSGNEILTSINGIYSVNLFAKKNNG